MSFFKDWIFYVIIVFLLFVIVFIFYSEKQVKDLEKEIKIYEQNQIISDALSKQQKEYARTFESRMNELKKQTKKRIENETNKTDINTSIGYHTIVY